ncbi:RNA polymerase II accessory factor CDC73 [Babesia caballi]|uniref:RNA polymerase II accessory factor CDC73 n=1 Tax=Babesia caballi TaxID=5871 RepID=A0AAV4LXG8_BABCB|nr:RNA polymerase II accessory factor CDC73 [Babesia caballi]
MDGSQPIFDDGWDARATQEHNAAYWADKASTSSITLLKSVYAGNVTVDFAMEPPGVLVCRVPEQNVTVNMLDPSGLRSRRGETYVIGDIILLLCVRREDYTYSSITKRGFKYINVLERDRIKSILDDPDTSPELLEAKTRYISIKTAGSGGVGGGKDDSGDDAMSPKGGSKHMIDMVMKRVEDSYRACMKDGSSEDEKEHKVAKKEFRNMCVLAATLIERPLRTRMSVITAHGEGFERVLQKLEAAQALKVASKPRDAPKSVGNVLRAQSKLRVLDEICCKYRKKPVIIVPSGTMSIVARHNIKQLLEDHQFVDPQEIMRSKNAVVSTLPMNAVEVIHTIAGRNIKFRVVENSYTTKFTTSDWISVVCVILNVKGGQWQFNGYPFESFVDMFMTMKGALFIYDTDNIPAEMNNWDLKVGVAYFCCVLTLPQYIAGVPNQPESPSPRRVDCEGFLAVHGELPPAVAAS